MAANTAAVAVATMAAAMAATGENFDARSPARSCAKACAHGHRPTGEVKAGRAKGSGWLKMCGIYAGCTWTGRARGTAGVGQMHAPAISTSTP